MKYRDAKKLLKGDQLIKKSDRSILTVVDVEVYGQHLLVRINCINSYQQLVSVYQDEVE